MWLGSVSSDIRSTELSFKNLTEGIPIDTVRLHLLWFTGSPIPSLTFYVSAVSTASLTGFWFFRASRHEAGDP